ncbi:MAG: BREX-1 system phosphatase PglZ type A [Methanobrevibacter sp.]|jgi:uncharacterized protein (TIGR02687 family)|nr:BREX-1 system phosphatase PglZ type A [Candidatus Methanovirga meridionalis]
MNLFKIQSKLKELFTSDSRVIVFWFDDKKQFQEEIDDLSLPEIVIHRLTESNWIYTKYLLEIEDKESNYLIYAPFEKLGDKNNPLADIIYYSKTFHADRLSFTMEELNIPLKFKDFLKRYSNFWNSNERINDFKKYNIADYDENNLIMAILCSLVKIKNLSFDELLKELFSEDNLQNNDYINQFRKMNISDDFWRLTFERYGFKDDKPTLEKFFRSLVLTYTKSQFEGNIPKAWERYIISGEVYINDISVFISNLMSNSNYGNKNHTYQEMYDINVSKIAESINIQSSVSRITPENYYACDTFEVFDIKITEHLSVLLADNEEYHPQINELVYKRMKTHFYKKFENHYSCLKWANFLIKNVNIFKKEIKPNDPEKIIDKYKTDWFFIDKAYRKFYYYYDNALNLNYNVIENKFKNLRDLIEKLYTNEYLNELAILWSNYFDGFDCIKYYKQYDFYKKFLLKHVSKHRTIVIISDALRYECGDELNDVLNEDTLRSTKLQPIISTLPSNTEFGMGSLLPHKTMKYNEKLIIDEISSDSRNREKILKNYFKDAFVVSYDDLNGMPSDELNSLKNYNPIYIYHNQIDARGDNSATENEVFKASKEAIDEISSLIKRLYNKSISTNFIVTSDHGFIYKKDSLSESDKINLSNKDLISKNKRYLLSSKKLDIDGTLSYPLNFLENELYITVPKGADIFKTSGAGLNYVHGGASLQEMLIPLIEVNVKSSKRDESQIELSLIAPINRTLTNSISYLKFAQNKKVSNKVSPLEAMIYIEDENGIKISNEIIIHANSEDDNPQKREFKEKITLKNKNYLRSEKYYLIIVDMENDTEIKRHDFIIDIAFDDGFEF